MDGALLEQAVSYAKTQASTIPPDFSTQVETFGRVLGPLPKRRGETNGIIIRHGYIVAEWGNTNQVDPTYSVAKSFLSALCGLAVDRGLIKSMRDPVKLYATDHGYDSAHNAGITWEEHLQQTSEWEGSLWGKPSNFLGTEEFGNGQRKERAIRLPGTYWDQPPVTFAVAGVAKASAGGAQRRNHGSDRRLQYVGVSRLPQFHDYDQWQRS
jgi:CubicO group peptidase (beta-lactamase class C family)